MKFLIKECNPSYSEKTLELLLKANLFLYFFSALFFVLSTFNMVFYSISLLFFLVGLNLSILPFSLKMIYYKTKTLRSELERTIYLGSLIVILLMTPFIIIYFYSRSGVLFDLIAKQLIFLGVVEVTTVILYLLLEFVLSRISSKRGADNGLIQDKEKQSKVSNRGHFSEILVYIYFTSFLVINLASIVFQF